MKNAKLNRRIQNRNAKTIYTFLLSFYITYTIPFYQFLIHTIKMSNITTLIKRISLSSAIILVIFMVLVIPKLRGGNFPKHEKVKLSR